MEAIEVFTLGDSLDAMIAEQEQRYIKSLYIDNQAAGALEKDRRRGAPVI